MMKGITMFCGLTGKYVHARMGLMAYIPDRPERSSFNNQLLLGTYGKRLLWAADIDSKDLLFCLKFCCRQIINLMSDTIVLTPLQFCGRCIQ